MSDQVEQGEWPAQDLPASWSWVTFAEAFRDLTSSDRKLPQNKYKPQGRYPVIDQGQQLVGGYSDDDSLAYEGPLPAIVFGDHTRCVKLIDRAFVQGADGVKVLTAATALDPRFAFLALRTIRLPDKGYSRHFKFLRASRFPVAPINEQRRIVAKLEALLARSRRAKEALDAIPALLERFRQSVLETAFRGDLTRDWREKNPDVEPASKFLERIRTERRHRWEEAELKRMRAKGKVPKDEQWKTKYEDPTQIGESGLQELPSGWAWASIEEVCPLDAPVVYGIILPGDDVQGGVPYIRPVDMNSNGTIDFTSMKRTSPSIAAQYQRASLRCGDIVLSIVGTIGKVIVVPDELDGGNITQSSARLRPPDWLSGEYLRFALLSPILRSQYNKFRFGNAVQRLNIEHVRRLAIPIAPAEEMKLMVTRAAAALACADKVQTVEQRQHLDKLEQSILAKAFRGELVSQDPTDEPASVLIERIRAQREKADQQQMPARSKRRRETKVA